MHCKFQDNSITVYRVITFQVEKIPGLFQTNEIEQMHKFVNTDSTSIFFFNALQLFGSWSQLIVYKQNGQPATNVQIGS